MPAKSAEKYSKKYSKFVVEIATDSDKMEKFRASPLKVAKAAGLTQQEMFVLLSGKASAILAGVDPSFREIRTFHVHVHVELSTPVHPMVPPCCQPTWTSLPTESRAKKASKTARSKSK